MELYITTGYQMAVSQSVSAGRAIFNPSSICATAQEDRLNMCHVCTAESDNEFFSNRHADYKMFFFFLNVQSLN